MERGKPFHHNRPIVLLVLSCLGLLFMPAVLAEGTVVRAVLFYAPTCPHCHQVMTEDLPPLLQEYGQQLEIVAVSTAHPDGHALYQAAIEHFAIAIERRGVPTLIIGETVLVGSLEIPQQLPGLIETHLAEGGLDWPDIPGFAEALGEAEATAEPATATNTIPAGTPRAEHAAGATATATVPSIAGAAHAGSSP